MKHFGTPGWTERTNRSVDDALAKGAVVVKVWKNIGMVAKDAQGPRLPRRSALRRRHAAHRGAAHSADRAPGRTQELLVAARPNDDRERQVQLQSNADYAKVRNFFVKYQDRLLYGPT
ncbi:hypothetical protein KX816_01470 [Sphingosinicellaceae bacterium]|nr:hypothetical protein KX816_01470 [Sphingosinicellaceae bacterium]